MDSKLKIINKINTIAIVCLFASLLLRIWLPFFAYVTIATSCIIYVTILLRSFIKQRKFNVVLTILCSASLAWVFVREYVDSPYIGAAGLVIVYAFLTWSSKLNLGKINKHVIIYGSIAVFCTLLNGVLDKKIIVVVIILLQLYIIYKFLDPILEKIGMAKREKRLAYEAMKKAKEEEESKMEHVHELEANEQVEISDESQEV